MCIFLKYGQSKDNYLNDMSKSKHTVRADRWIYDGTDLTLEPKLLLMSVQSVQIYTEKMIEGALL